MTRSIYVICLWENKTNERQKKPIISLTIPLISEVEQWTTYHFPTNISWNVLNLILFTFYSKCVSVQQFISFSSTSAINIHYYNTFFTENFLFSLSGLDNISSYIPYCLLHIKEIDILRLLCEMRSLATYLIISLFRISMK